MEERPIPTPGPGDVLIRVSSVGVCGSDTHYYRHGRVGSFVVDGPLVLGHEAAGTIVGVGESVDPKRIGERVSIEPQRNGIGVANAVLIGVVTGAASFFGLFILAVTALDD